MKTNTNELVQDLLKRTNNQLDFIKSLSHYSEKELNWKENNKTWSVLECIEHLNLYGDFYIPEIDIRIKKSTYQPSKFYTSSWLGDYFVKSVSPQSISKKMNTFKDKNPNNSNLSISTLTRFETQLKKVQELVEKSSQINLQKTKTSISISKIIKLRLGDTFRVLIYHNDRHILQANNVLDKIKKPLI